MFSVSLLFGPPIYQEDNFQFYLCLRSIELHDPRMVQELTAVAKLGLKFEGIVVESESMLHLDD